MAANDLQMRFEKWVGNDTLSGDERRLLDHFCPGIGDRLIIHWKKEICSISEGDDSMGTKYKKYIGSPYEANGVQVVIYVPW